LGSLGLAERRGVIEVKKTTVAVLALAVVLLISPLIGTVFAGKGQTRKSFEYYYEEWPIATDGPDAHASPRGAVDYRTFHGRDTTHDSPLLDYAITIDGNLEERFTITLREGGCDYEFNAKTMMVIHRATETLTFGSYGIIVLSIIEKIDFSTMASEGTFVGFGTGIFEDVKIVGTSSSGVVGSTDFGGDIGVVPILGVTIAGTVMGWP